MNLAGGMNHADEGGVKLASGMNLADEGGMSLVSGMNLADEGGVNFADGGGMNLTGAMNFAGGVNLSDEGGVNLAGGMHLETVRSNNKAELHCCQTQTYRRFLLEFMVATSSSRFLVKTFVSSICPTVYVCVC